MPDTQRRGGMGILLRRWNALCDGVTGILFVGGAIAMFAMVVTRYGFAWSDPSIEIIVRYCMIWGTFIGISAGSRYGVNIRFTLLEHLLNEFGRRVIRTIGHVLTLLIAAALAVSGYTFAAETMMFNEVMPTALRWLVWPFHAAISAGGVLLCIQVIRSIVGVWQSDAGPAADTADAGAI